MDINSLVIQMRRRQQARFLREFLKVRKIEAKSFVQMETNLREAVATGKVKNEELASLFFRHTTFGHKRVLLLREPPAEIKELGEQAPKGLTMTPIVGKGAKRPVGSQKMPGFLVSHWKADGIEGHTFATVRTVSHTEDIDRAALKEGVRDRFENAQLVAKFDEAHRCFDHVVTVHGRTFLLLDRPPGVDAAQVSTDLRKYAEKLNGEQLGSPFLDFWPAVGAVYDDAKEGMINALQFESNDKAHATGRFGVLQDLDYRENKYHKGGSSVGQVAVFALAVAWKLPEDRAYVVLPGTRGMLSRIEVNGVMYPPLQHVDFVLPTTHDAFLHATKRLLGKLPA